jgi:hypothetical protein
MKIIKRAERVEAVEYSLYFESIEFRGGGFSFPCSKDGVVGELAPAGQANYEMCLKDNGKTYENMGVESNSWSYMEPAEGRCDCGSTVVLSHDETECSKCKRLYNIFGQELRRLSPEEEAYERANDYAYSSEELY